MTPLRFVHHNVWWGVRLEGTGLLGGAWCRDENGKNSDVKLPPWVTNWPAVFRTRFLAREMARRLTKRFLYLRPTHTWVFRSVRLNVMIEEEKA